MSQEPFSLRGAVFRRALRGVRWLERLAHAVPAKSAQVRGGSRDGDSDYESMIWWAHKSSRLPLPLFWLRTVAVPCGRRVPRPRGKERMWLCGCRFSGDCARLGPESEMGDATGSTQGVGWAGSFGEGDWSWKPSPAGQGGPDRGERGGRDRAGSEQRPGPASLDGRQRAQPEALALSSRNFPRAGAATSTPGSQSSEWKRLAEP